jgi:hypothetical protein
MTRFQRAPAYWREGGARCRSRGKLTVLEDQWQAAPHDHCEGFGHERLLKLCTNFRYVCYFEISEFA